MYIGDKNDYTGIVLYQYEGQKEWVLNGHRCKSGYTVILNSDMLKGMKKKLGISMEGEVHGLAYYYLFKEKKIPKNIVAEGFAIMKGECKWNSRVFNARDNEYNLPGPREITDKTKEQLIIMIKEWKEAGILFKFLPGKRDFPVK